jgi:glycosyltransferase involved in cell wall biosynthesis
MLDITVVIPTYNRRALLRDAVESLRRQTYPADKYEIIVVSDGATDGTDDDYAIPLTSPLTRLVRQEKQGFGLSRARNNGLRAAQGRLIMFFDDDMAADERMVEKHVAAHAQFGGEVVVRGRVELSTRVPDTPFCRIVLGDVCRIYEPHPDQPGFVEFDTALSWQTSFKQQKLMELGGYDEAFQCYGWEDIEFSYRMSRRGLRFYYEPGAVSHHNDQRQTLTAHGERLRNAALMAPRLFSLHPELVKRIPMYVDKEPVAWGRDAWALVARKLVRQLTATRPVLNLLEGLTPAVERLISSPIWLRRWYYGVLGAYSLLGYREGLMTLRR